MRRRHKRTKNISTCRRQTTIIPINAWRTQPSRSPPVFGDWDQNSEYGTSESEVRLDVFGRTCARRRAKIQTAAAAARPTTNSATTARVAPADRNRARSWRLFASRSARVPFSRRPSSARRSSPVRLCSTGDPAGTNATPGSFLPAKGGTRSTS